MRRWLKRIAVTIGGLVAVAIVIVGVLAIYVSVAWNRPIRRPVVALSAPRSAAAVDRGRHLYNYSMSCWTCHGSRGGLMPNEPQAGGREFDLRDVGPGFGLYYGTNLTSDAETGIGAFSDGELVRALREGIGHDGRLLFPVMPYSFYHGLSDDDALAVVAYMRTLPPVRNPVPRRRPSFAARALITFGALKPEAPIQAPVVAPPPGVTVEYGRYLAWHASGCAECHSPRSPKNGQFDPKRPLAGGLFPFPERNMEATGSNLTPDVATGLGAWTEEQFLYTMRHGTRPDGRVMPTFMPWPIYAEWSDEDLRALWMYLRSLPPDVHAIPRGHLTGAAANAHGVVRGEALFEVYCFTCHGGRKEESMLSNISLYEFVADESAEQVAAVIANGTGKEEVTMPAFGKTLDADAIADIVAYLKR